MRVIASVSFALSLLAVPACDLQPPPPRSQSTTTATQDAGSATPSRVGKPVTAEECVKIGEHFAQVLIDTATDPAEKAILEQERDRNVRRQGETCEQNKWDDATRTCFLNAKTRLALQQCITAAAETHPSPAGSADLANEQARDAAGTARAQATASGSGSAGSAAPAGSAAGSASGSGSGSGSATPARPRPRRPNR